MLLTSQLLLPKILLVEFAKAGEQRGDWSCLELGCGAGFPCGAPMGQAKDITEKPWKTKGKPWKTGGKHRKPRLNFEQHQILMGNMPRKSWDITNHHWDLTDHVPGVIRCFFFG